jgi:hypothetical protein
MVLGVRVDDSRWDRVEGRVGLPGTLQCYASSLSRGRIVTGTQLGGEAYQWCRSSSQGGSGSLTVLSGEYGVESNYSGVVTSGEGCSGGSGLLRFFLPPLSSPFGSLHRFLLSWGLW